MSASNHNYVCFACRTSVRYPKTAKLEPKCLTCDSECFCLGYKVEVPKHSDRKAWLTLEKECKRRAQALAGDLILKNVRHQHSLEQETKRLSQMPENRDRSRKLKELRIELLQLTSSRTSGTVAI